MRGLSLPWRLPLKSSRKSIFQTSKGIGNALGQVYRVKRRLCREINLQFAKFSFPFLRLINYWTTLVCTGPFKLLPHIIYVCYSWRLTDAHPQTLRYISLDQYTLINTRGNWKGCALHYITAKISQKSSLFVFSLHLQYNSNSVKCL